jgi:hypothetical protein
MNIPIILIHAGNQSYVNFCINQALKYDNSVIILGDEQINPNAAFYKISEYEGFAAKFDHTYVHMSDGPSKFEIKAWRRWFVLADFMNRNNIEKAFSCDTDVLLYCNVTEIEKTLGNYTAAFTIPEYQPEYRISASSHVSFWTRKGINDFCYFSLELYKPENIKVLKEKWEYHIKNKIPGGICDMTAAYLFYKENKDNIINLISVRNGETFDYNISSPQNFQLDEYLTKDEIKKIIWKNGIPYCYNKILNKNIRFYSFHFQGEKKNLMEYFYYKNSILFNTKKHIKYFIKSLINLTK